MVLLHPVKTRLKNRTRTINTGPKYMLEKLPDIFSDYFIIKSSIAVNLDVRSK